MPWLSKYYQEIFGTAGQRTAFSMRTNTVQILIRKTCHIFLLILDRTKTQPKWQKTGASSPIAQKYFFQCSHKFFSSSMKQQNSNVCPLTTAGFLDGKGGMENSPGLGEELCQYFTQFLGSLNSTGMWFLPLQLTCSVNRSFVNTSTGLESLERVLLLEVSMQCGGCGKSQPVMSCPWTSTRVFMQIPSAASPHGSRILQLSRCVRGEERGQEESRFQKAPHCLLNTICNSHLVTNLSSCAHLKREPHHFPPSEE